MARWWPILAGAGLLALLWWRIDKALDAAHARGVADERVRWTSAAMNAQREAHANAARQQAGVDAADSKAAADLVTARNIETRHVEKIRILYRDRVDPLCVDPDGMRIIADADRERAAATAAGGGTDPVRKAGAW